MLSIIILSYRNPALLRLCLQSLFSSIPESLEYEVIVVDGATSPETRNVVVHEFQSKFKHLQLIPVRENTGYTRGVNIGLKAARGEYLLSLNPDIVVTKGAIEKLLTHLKQHPEIGLIGPQLLNFNGTHQDSYFRFYTPLTIFYRRISHLPFSKKILDTFLMRDTDPNKIQKPDWISGAAYMTTRSALKKVGYLDESLFHYFSDVDWARRFWDNGYQVVYYPEATMYHYLGRSSKGKLLFWDILFNQPTRWHIQDFFRYCVKYKLFFRPFALSRSAAHATNH